MAKKIRLDQLLVERGLFPSREKAQASILAGLIRVDGQLRDKVGTPVGAEVPIEVLGKPHPYVSRGGLKLEKALEMLGWEVAGWQAVDLGASTGGFTDCLLQRGAHRVCAVDVGRGQLDLKLQQDERVLVKDRCNARYLQSQDLPFVPDLVTADLAFISLKLIFPVVWEWNSPRLITLIKPQFETRPKNLRKGVVHDPGIHREVLEEVLEAAAAQGWKAVNVGHSPLRGPAGNLEFVAGFLRDASKNAPQLEGLEVDQIVAQAHQQVE